jgi:hypothetical protein
MQEAIMEQSAPEDQKQTPQLYKKTRIAMAMVEAGISPREALQTVHNRDDISYDAENNLKNKIQLYSIATPSMVKLAHAQLRRMLKGKAREIVKDKIRDANGRTTYKMAMVSPSEGNIITAAQMVLDRAEPVRSQQTGGNTTNIFNFDPRSSIKIAEIVTQAAGQLSVQQPASNQPAAHPVDAQVIDVPRLPDNTTTNTPDQW